MPSWNELVNDFQGQPDDAARSKWLVDQQTAALKAVGALRGDRNVVVYASAFLQKPAVPAYLTQITYEDLNGFMSVIYGMDWHKGLTLLIHTPGGSPNAAETLVAYLRTKFSDIEVVVPALAMSAGTMISLAAERIVMGRQSQLGPIDPQMPTGGRYVSGRAIVEQFDRAKTEILKDLNTAHAWVPILQSMGPALLQEAQNALDYGETLVARWLAQYMFAGQTDAVTKGDAIARHFNDASTHKSHGRRIDRDEARSHGVVVEDLETNQALQEAVLTAYHLMTIAFTFSLSTKMIWSHEGRQWNRTWAPAGSGTP